MKPITQPRLKAKPARRVAGRAQNDHRLDPYQLQQKLKEPTVCRQSGLVYQHGR